MNRNEGKQKYVKMGWKKQRYISKSSSALAAKTKCVHTNILNKASGWIRCEEAKKITAN